MARVGSDLAKMYIIFFTTPCTIQDTHFENFISWFLLHELQEAYVELITLRTKVGRYWRADSYLVIKRTHSPQGTDGFIPTLVRASPTNHGQNREAPCIRGSFSKLRARMNDRKGAILKVGSTRQVARGSPQNVLP